MSESNTQRPTRRRSERAEQIYNARMLPDADETFAYEAEPAQKQAADRRQAYEQRLTEPAKLDPAAQPVSQPRYDESLFTPNEPTDRAAPVRFSVPAEQPSPVQPEPFNEAGDSWADSFPFEVGDPYQEPAFDEPDGSGFAEEIPEEPAPASERSALAANLSAYYRRAANVSAQEEDDPFAPLDWPDESDGAAMEDAGDDLAASVNVYRMQEASWAQEERQTMLTGEAADGYQVQTEERRQPAKRRRKKRLLRRAVIALAAVAVVLIGVWLLFGQSKPQTVLTSGDDLPVITPTPQPIRAYDAAPVMAVSGKASEAIDQISGPVEMATCAVTNHNVLTRSMRADGLYDFYLFASDGRLLAYFDKLPADGMHPVEGGGFYVAMEPWLVDEEGRAMISLGGLEATVGDTLALRPPMNGWARILASSGESNLINRDGQLLSRLWFSRSFPLTGNETVAYVDTGVEGSPTRYTLYIVNGAGEGSVVKWQDAADEQGVVTSALGMAYLQNGELYRLADLLKDPAAAPLCTTANVRFYTDCGAMVVQDAASGKYALYVNGEQHYDFVYDSILPVESDVRWQGEVLTGASGQAAVLAVSGASYPQPLSHYFVLNREGAEEYVALSALTNCPILLD